MNIEVQKWLLTDPHLQSIQSSSAGESTMVSSISSSTSTMAMFGTQQFKGATALTDEQKQTVSDILSNYDAENLSEDDVHSILDSLKDAGIQPGAGLKEAISDAGFDADEILKPPSNGGHGTPPPPPPSGSEFGQVSSQSGIDLSTLQSLQDILSQFDLSNLSDEDQQNLVSQLTDSGLMSNGSLINLSA
jgi:hypothetical protein